MQTYGQFCAVARALEVLGQRWTLLVVRELMCGATRFNDIRQGLPSIPRSTLVDRLGALERAEVVARVDGGYELTEAGRGLVPVIGELARWAHRWDRRGLTDDHLDPEALLHDIRRRLREAVLPAERVVVGFVFTDRPATDRHLYLHLGGHEPALCREGHPDIEVRGDTRTLTRWWLGELPWAEASFEVRGRRDLERALPTWFLGYAFPAPAA
jgi:DNA-binding HxlR family transcriptional regulator